MKDKMGNFHAKKEEIKTRWRLPCSSFPEDALQLEKKKKEREREIKGVKEREREDPSED